MCYGSPMDNVLYLSITLCVFVAMVVQVDGLSNAFGTATFSITANAPLGNYNWRASAACSLQFTGTSYNVGESYILVRFGVPITNIEQDNSNGAMFQQYDKWYITQVGYAGNNQFHFTVTFDYNTWLGGAYPLGECGIYIGTADALTDASQTPELTNTLADPLLSAVPLQITSFDNQNNKVNALCPFDFPGINFGQYETVILVNATVPVTGIGDYNGGTISMVADDLTWFMATNPQSLFNTFNYNTYFTTPETLVDPKCYLYHGMSLTGITGSMTLDAVLAYGSSAGSATSTTGVPMITTTAATTSANSTLRDALYEDTGMRNTFVESGNIWQIPETNIVRCSRRCLGDPQCNSIFFEYSSSRCTAHTDIKASGTTASGVRYFIVN